jgi:hypothetical protein
MSVHFQSSSSFGGTSRSLNVTPNYSKSFSKSGATLMRSRALGSLGPAASHQAASCSGSGVARAMDAYALRNMEHGRRYSARHDGVIGKIIDSAIHKNPVLANGGPAWTEDGTI